MANYTTTITNEGAALLASVIANQGTLTFNEFRFSENDYTGQESTLTEGTFLGVFITASAAASVIDSTTIKASAQFNNSTITGNHNLYSIGIVGTDGNTTALIAVCTTTDPDVIREPLTGTSTYAFNVNLSVSDTSQITVVGTTAAVIYDIDVVNNLTSPAIDKPLAANMGRVLGENIEAIVDVYGAKNQSNQTFTSQTLDQVSHTPNADGSLTVTTNGASTSTVVAAVISTSFTVEKGTYLFTFEKDSDEPTTSPYSIIARDSSNTYVCGSTQTKAQRTVTFAQDTTIHYECYCGANNVVSDVTFYPMIRDDRITDPTYAPYAKTNQQLTANVSGLSNRNLVDNGWFTVNQRGAASYTDGQYSADRWKVAARNYGGSGITVNSNGVTIAFANANEEYVYINQKFENSPWKGKTVTVSLIANGVLYAKSFDWTNGGSGTFDISDSPKIQISWNDTTPQISIVSFADAVTFRAVKLEVGSVSTLALDVAPDYTTELLKCQRYFVRITARASYAVMASGLMDNATYFWGAIPLSVPLRANPTVTKGGVFNLRQNGSLNSVTDVTVDYRAYGELSVFVTPDTSLTANAPAMFVFNSASTYIDLSADL